jgi:hypothetical protein
MGSRTLLLLEYILPAAVLPRFPTIVEACSGEDWNYYFYPAPESEVNWGWTQPWDMPLGGGGVPEVVHPVIRGDCLLQELVEIT